jgi:hypothetical protein
MGPGGLRWASTGADRHLTAIHSSQSLHILPICSTTEAIRSRLRIAGRTRLCHFMHFTSDAFYLSFCSDFDSQVALQHIPYKKLDSRVFHADERAESS